MSPELTAVLRALPKLQPHELRQIQLKAGASLALSGVTAKQIIQDDPIGDYLLDGVIAELRRRGLLGQSGGLFKRLMPPAYQEASAGVRKHLNERVGQLKAGELAALGQLSARALADYLERGRVPVSPATLMNNISKVPVAIDASFPGYLEAGVLASCWRK